MLDQFTLALEVVIRHVRQDDVRRLEWFGLLTPFRDVIQRAYARAEQGEIAFLVADLNGFPVGQVWVDFVRQAEAGVGVIWALRVLEPLQNLGIGSHLIRAAESAITARRLRTAEIAVSVENLAARRLYERLGYRVIRAQDERWSYATLDGVLHPVEEREWILRKTLEAP
ncbi:MAG: GNAT family N-acetyltransferase [Anaerolineae bacterium]|nr:GNAT family N-acetyltransferase [Anaerolineae bacterium]